MSSGGDFDGGRFRVSVFFSIRAIAVAVFEVEPEVLDWFPTQLLGDAAMHPLCGRGFDSQDGRERGGIRRVLLEDAQRGDAQARRGVSLEQVSAAVDGVDWLPGRGHPPSLHQCGGGGRR